MTHLLLISLRDSAWLLGRRLLLLNALRMCCWVVVTGSRGLRPYSFLLRKSSARGGVCVRHCSTEFMKQVFPRLCSPQPCR